MFNHCDLQVIFVSEPMGDLCYLVFHSFSVVEETLTITGKTISTSTVLRLVQRHVVCHFLAAERYDNYASVFGFAN